MTLARAEGLLNRGYVGRLLRRTLLAPGAAKAVLDGRLPKGVRLQDLERPLPSGWREQRRVLRAETPRAGGRPRTTVR